MNPSEVCPQAEVDSNEISTKEDTLAAAMDQFPGTAHTDSKKSRNMGITRRKKKKENSFKHSKRAQIEKDYSKEAEDNM